MVNGYFWFMIHGSRFTIKSNSMAYKKEYSKVGKKYTTTYKPKRGANDGSRFMVQGEGFL